MAKRRFVVMGAGEVGRYLARSLAADGHLVTLVDSDPDKQTLVEEQLDVGFVLGNGSHVPTLERAQAGTCDLFVAVSSVDEANLAAALLAKRLGARRAVVRVTTTDDVTRYRHVYERAFHADFLLSTQLLTTTQIMNHVLGHNTLEVEYLAGGTVQVRRTSVEQGSVLAERTLAAAGLPGDCLVLAFIDEGRVTVPTGADQAKVGDDLLVIGTLDAVDAVERKASGHARRPGLVVIAGGGETARAAIQGLSGRVARIKVIERDRATAEALAADFPRHDVVHADATDASILAAEGIQDARAFVALTGNDETNLMACLLAQEQGIRQLTALVQKSETSTLWRKIALLDVVSPRTLAAEQIRSYIDNDFEAHITSFENGAAQFVQRHVHALSPAVGSTLDKVEVPQGLIVAAVLRDGVASVPRGNDEIRVGDDVILFVRQTELDMVQLLFPGSEIDSARP